MLRDFIIRIKLLFRKDKELYFKLKDIIGFYPRNIDLYKQALLHRSVMKRNEKGKPVNNERLEFLGDAVLDAVVGCIVYKHFPGKREGFLTTTRSKLVQRETLGKLASEMGITKLINSSKSSFSHNSYIGGNAFEALVGAIYLDKGYDACMKFVEKRILDKLINIDKMAYKEINFKSKLLEWSQKNHIIIDFILLEQGRDDDGNPTFEYKVTLENVDGCAGKGFSKKESQQKASKLTLEKLRKDKKYLDSIFAAKSDRTKMEEEPYTSVPDTEKPQRTSKNQPSSSEQEEKKNPKPKRKPAPRNAKPEKTATDDGAENVESNTDENQNCFDLSDISAKEKSKEEIIAEAETAAFDQE